VLRQNLRVPHNTQVDETFREEGLQVLGAIMEPLNNPPQLRVLLESCAEASSAHKLFLETYRFLEITLSHD
jgi:hypothetical protein